MITSQRLQELPPYLFDRIDQLKAEQLALGRSLISLAVGDPDLPTPEFIVRALQAAAERPENHHYPSYRGLPELRQAVSRFMERRYQVQVDPLTQVLILIGSKEGIAHLPLAFLNPGDTTLVPDPAYPVYAAGTQLALGRPIPFVLKREHHYLPQLAELDALRRIHQPKILFLNYPNNPTAAVATPEFFAEIVTWARKHQIMLCHDHAYGEIYYGKPTCSLLQTPGALDIGCEFHSLSKSFNMTGWRIGFVVGHPDIIAGLGKVKTHIDSGAFDAVQWAAVQALDEGDAFVQKTRRIYQARRDALVPGLNAAGLDCALPEASFYAWAQISQARSSSQYVMDLIERCGVIATPGVGFGAAGEGYVRFTFCAELSILKQVALRLGGSL